MLKRKTILSFVFMFVLSFFLITSCAKSENKEILWCRFENAYITSNMGGSSSTTVYPINIYKIDEAFICDSDGIQLDSFVFVAEYYLSENDCDYFLGDNVSLSLLPEYITSLNGKLYSTRHAKYVKIKLSFKKREKHYPIKIKFKGEWVNIKAYVVKSGFDCSKDAFLNVWGDVDKVTDYVNLDVLSKTVVISYKVKK